MKKDNEEKTIDPLTGEEFVPKRSNQKFASRENQIRYNNLKARDERQSKARTRKILNNNRKVLRKVLGSSDEIVRSLDFLLGSGMDLQYCTHTIKIQNLKWTCIDDYAYTLIDTNTFKIIKLKQ